MAEFKDQAEYQKWKTEKSKQPQQNQLTNQEIKKHSSEKAMSPNVKNKASKKVIFFLIGLLLIGLIPSTYFIWSYLTHGKLSGNIYVTMKSGDIKKAAGIEVYLLKVDNPDNILAEVDKIMNADIRPYGEAVQKWAEVTDDYKWNVDQVDKYKSLGYINLDEHEKNYSAISEVNADKALKESANLEQYVNQLKEEHNKRIGNLLFPLKFTQIKTDINGYFEFKNIPHGKYILLTTYEVFSRQADWLYPIEINAREHKIDLTNNNEKRAFF